MASQQVSNKCHPSSGRQMGVTQVRNMLAAAVLASLLCLATTAPTSDSDGSQKQSSSLASPTLSLASSHSSILLPLPSSSSSSSLSSSSSSHRNLVKRSAPAPYAGHSIMRFGRAAHSIMHFGKRSEQPEENVANEPIDGTGSETDADDWKQYPLLTDGVNRFVLLPVYGTSGKSSKRAKFQDEVPAAVGRDNVFMHFG